LVDGLVAVAQGVAQGAGGLEFGRCEQEFFAAGAGLGYVDGRVDAAAGGFAVKFEFGVAGALVLLVQQGVCGGTGLDQGGGEHGERAACSRSRAAPSSRFRGEQCARVHAAGEHAAGRWRGQAVGTAEAGERVEQDHDVTAEFDQPLGALDGEFGDRGVVGWWPVECGRDHLALDRPPDVGYFFGSFADEHHHDVAFGVVVRDAVGDLLQDTVFPPWVGRRSERAGPCRRASSGR